MLGGLIAFRKFVYLFIQSFNDWNPRRVWLSSRFIHKSAHLFLEFHKDFTLVLHLFHRFLHMFIQPGFEIDDTGVPYWLSIQITFRLQFTLALFVSFLDSWLQVVSRAILFLRVSMDIIFLHFFLIDAPYHHIRASFTRHFFFYFI